MIGLPCLCYLVNVYTSSSNPHNSVYAELPGLIFSLCRSVKLPILFIKNLFENVTCANIRIVSECNMRRLVY